MILSRTRKASGLALLTLSLATAACDRKKQYNQADPVSIDGTSTVVTGEFDSDPSIGPGKQTDLQTLQNELKEIQSRPVVWGKSAGNIVIGSSITEHEKEMDRYWSANLFTATWSARYLNPFTFQEVFVLGLVDDPVKGVISDRIHSIRIYGAYTGTITYYDAEGTPIPIPVSSKQNILAETKFGTDLLGFFNAFVQNSVKKTDRNCFEMKICDLYSFGDTRLLRYRFPTGETGFLIMTDRNFQLVGAGFALPAVSLSNWFDSETTFSLSKGEFAKQRSASDTLTLGQAYKDIAGKFDNGSQYSNIEWTDDPENPNYLCKTAVGLKTCFGKSDKSELLQGKYYGLSPRPDDKLVKFTLEYSLVEQLGARLRFGAQTDSTPYTAESIASKAQSMYSLSGIDKIKEVKSLLSEAKESLKVDLAAENVKWLDDRFMNDDLPFGEENSSLAIEWLGTYQDSQGHMHRVEFSMNIKDFKLVATHELMSQESPEFLTQIYQPGVPGQSPTILAGFRLGQKVQLLNKAFNSRYITLAYGKGLSDCSDIAGCELVRAGYQENTTVAYFDQTGTQRNEKRVNARLVSFGNVTLHLVAQTDGTYAVGAITVRSHLTESVDVGSGISLNYASTLKKDFAAQLSQSQATYIGANDGHMFEILREELGEVYGVLFYDAGQNRLQALQIYSADLEQLSKQ